MSFMVLQIDEKWKVVTTADSWYTADKLELYRHNEILDIRHGLQLDNLHRALISELYKARQQLDQFKKLAGNLP
jgi:hypothetical protein